MKPHKDGRRYPNDIVGTLVLVAVKVAIVIGMLVVSITNRPVWIRLLIARNGILIVWSRILIIWSEILIA